MNVMAHLALAGDDPDLVLGQFLGDFVRGPVHELPYPETVQAGITAHRRVDAASDRSELYARAKEVLEPRERRFAGIVMDMYGDYLLHLHWSGLMSDDFPHLRARWREILAHPHHPLPADARRFAGTILDHNLLTGYRDLDEIRYALHRIGQRLRRPAHLEAMLEPILDISEDIEAGFPGFFREMQELAAGDQAGLPEPSKRADASSSGVQPLSPRDGGE